MQKAVHTAFRKLHLFREILRCQCRGYALSFLTVVESLAVVSEVVHQNQGGILLLTIPVYQFLEMRLPAYHLSTRKGRWSTQGRGSCFSGIDH